MKIDTHVHFWRYSAQEYEWIDESMSGLRRDFLPGDLRPEISGAGVDACVAVQARQTVEETSWLLDLAERHPWIAGVVGWVDLQADDLAATLERYAGRPKLVGLRHIVQSEPDDRFMLRPAFCRGVSLVGERGLTYDILIYPRHLAVAAELVSRCGATRFVLDHLAKPEVRSGEIREWERGMRELATCPQVVCKLSGLVTEADWQRWTPDQLRPYLDVAFDCFGPDRLMVGSDWPVCTVASSYQRTMSVIDAYVNARPDADRRGVMGENAMHFWKLEARELV
jgi:L-fuconolactonase